MKHKKFITIRLSRDTIEDIIDSYEFFIWLNKGEERKKCRRIVKKFKQSLL